MPSFNIIKKSEISKSFKSTAIKDRYDISEKKITETFTGEINIPEEWNIGIIVGASGSGKTSIAREIFKITDIIMDESLPVIDQFKSELKIVENILRNVGFSSVPSWLKPYGVLSNGEKMRVDLAMAIDSDNDVIVFDEFTSVVDRHIAQIGSFAIQKAIRKQNKKFVAVSCHYDIIDWLQPDWIFDTKEMKTTITRGLLQRPKIYLQVRKVRGYWAMFKRHHYLSCDLAASAEQFVCFNDNNPIAFIAVLHQPHPTAKNIKRVSRIVVDPEWQGISVGRVFLECIGDYYLNNGYRYRITTSNPALTMYFNKSKHWIIDHRGYNGDNKRMKELNKTVRKKVKTISAEYTKNASES